MNRTQAFEFLGNGGLWGFDRRYVGLDSKSTLIPLYVI